MACRREGEDRGKTTLESLVGLPLTRDHTPLDPGERERLTRVSDIRIIDGRVNGQLEVSRSFGDYQFKRHGVSCLPDVRKYELVRGRDRYIPGSYSHNRSRVLNKAFLKVLYSTPVRK